VAARRPTPLIIVIQLVLLCAVGVVAVLAAPSADWDPALLGLLLGFAILTDLAGLDTASRIRVSGSFLSLVIAMVLLGGSPAALLGALTILAGWVRWREKPVYLVNNVLTYAVFPLAGGILFHAVLERTGLSSTNPTYYLLVFALSQFALATNFLMIAGYGCYIERRPFSEKLRVLPPVLPSELVSAMLAVGVTFLYHEVGIVALALFAIATVTFQHLLGALLLSQERSGELEVRTRQLASFQVGMLSALLRTLDLRDQMTARHSAAVASYSRAIARRAGLSRREEELVHIAALLHDVGKFILPDRILKADVPLTDEDWMLIRRHPQQGARVAASLDGYGPVAEIILAHHERIDGNGYPLGLAGDEIPEMARIISVADTSDVMTARDSYRTPVSAHEAVQELRRVAGRQLDARFVEIFIELLEAGDVSFQHGAAANFERELALEARLAGAANPDAGVSRLYAPRTRTPVASDSGAPAPGRLTTARR
jgi:putative nucleotidyltransferase with HDIG domain